MLVDQFNGNNFHVVAIACLEGGEEEDEVMRVIKETLKRLEAEKNEERHECVLRVMQKLSERGLKPHRLVGMGESSRELPFQISHGEMIDFGNHRKVFLLFFDKKEKANMMMGYCTQKIILAKEARRRGEPELDCPLSEVCGFFEALASLIPPQEVASEDEVFKMH